MNAIVKAWRNFKIRVANRRQCIAAENKFQIGDWVAAKDPYLHLPEESFDLTGSIYSFGEAGEVVDAFYGFDMNRGYKWHYKVQYKKRDTVVVLYEETEICIDAAWIREQKLKKLGI